MSHPSHVQIARLCIAAISVSALWGCSSALEYPVAPEALRDIIRDPNSRRFETKVKGHEVTPTQEHSPHLKILSAKPCSISDAIALRCRDHMQAPLAHYQLDDTGALKVPLGVLLNETQFMTLEPEEIASATLLLHGFAPPYADPSWGVGTRGGGQAGVFAVEGYAFITSWWLLELGFGPDTLFTGTRLRLPTEGALKPFIGTSIGVLGLLGTDLKEGDPGAPRALSGVKAGLDIALPSRRWLVSFDVGLYGATDITKDFAPPSFTLGSVKLMPWSGLLIGYQGFPSFSPVP